MVDFLTTDSHPCNKYKEVWKRLERPETQPRRIRRILTVDFTEFEEQILAQKDSFVEETISSFYAGDIFVLKNVFSDKFMLDYRRDLHEYGLKVPPSFHKMLEGCPNFHRIIDQKIAAEQKYSFDAIKHSYYFFPWNKDSLGRIEIVYEKWRPLKFLGGHRFDEYEKNTPKDEIVDRLQIAHYPLGAGCLELHSDPYLFHRIIVSGIMSQRGTDFETGGVYFLDAKNKKVDLEAHLEVGDIYLSYPTIFHGVDTVDEGKPVDWQSIRGRWWLGVFTSASDHVQNRHTGYRVLDVKISG